MKLLQSLPEQFVTSPIDNNDFQEYQNAIIHEWLQTITALVIALVPIFFVLDTFITPTILLPRFGVYRAISTLIALVQHLSVRRSKPSRWTFLNGYVVSLHVGGVIALMTVDLGGFQSGYYVGLIMVIIGANLLMPWRAIHTAVNASIIIVFYVAVNIITPASFAQATLTNNLFFLVGTSIIAVAINHVRYRLIQSEFSLLVQLKQARDSLWGEMEVAKDIQMALLPRTLRISGYDAAAMMVPATEVGGDYYEVFETARGDRYVAVGDVAGHGLNAGLVMMMAQTAVMTVIKNRPDCTPSTVIESVNRVLRENIGRLNSNQYMTMSVLKLEDDRITVAGHHQDLIVYRAGDGTIEIVEVPGTWLGIADDLSGFIKETDVLLSAGDAIMLYTDGLTEAKSASGEMYGEDRLRSVFRHNAVGRPREAVAAVISEVRAFQQSQSDDISAIVLKRR